MARVLWFVVRNAAGDVVKETTELDAALRARREYRGRTMEQEWRASSPRVEKVHTYGGEA